MSSQPPSSSSSTVPPTFQDNTSPALFLEWLQERMATLTDPRRTNKNLEWTQTIAALVPVLWVPLPSEAQSMWKALHEKSKLCELSLQLTDHALRHVPMLFKEALELPETLLVTLTILCTSLDLWIEVDPPSDGKYLTPSELYDRVRTVLVEVLQVLGENVDPTNNRTSWTAMREMVVLCCGLVNDILSFSSTTEYPSTLEMRISPAGIKFLQGWERPTAIEVANSSQAPLVLSTLLDICLGALSAVITNRPLLIDLAREIEQLTQKVYDHVFFAPLAIGTTRLRAAARICKSLSALASSIGVPDLAEPYWSRLLLCRLEVGPDPVWERVDSALADSLRSSKMSPQNLESFYSVVRWMQEEDWGEEGDTIRDLCTAYLLLFVPSLNEDVLRDINTMFATETKASSYTTLLNAVNDQLHGSAATQDVNAATPTFSWRGRARDAVQVIVNPHVMDWMDDDDSLPDIAFIQRSLHEINHRFEQDPVWNNAPEALESLAKQLAALPCLLFHDDQTCTPAANDGKGGICFISTYMKVAFRILESDDARRIHQSVRAAVYDALAKSLRHQTAPLGERLLEDLMTFIGRGMKAIYRPIRMAAGRTSVELVKFVQRSQDRVAEFIVNLFQLRLLPLLRHRDGTVKETTILTVGVIGKSSTGPALRESLCGLVLQLGQMNPLHKGTAILQLHALARHYKKSPFSLTMPYFDRIAPMLVRRMNTEPQGISEFCSFISMAPPGYLKLTLKYTLPHLFADNDVKALQAVADTVQEKIDSKVGFLVLEHSAYILAHVFMLQGVGQTNKCLQLILKLMQEEVTNPDALTIQSVIRSCLVTLLTELVVALGDEDLDVVDAAHQGLIKVSRVLKAGGDDTNDLAAFLKDHMLGIITTLNDMVQEVREKKTPETKQRILRSLGEFARRVGRDICNVGPQIMATLQTMLLIPKLSDPTLNSWYWFLFSLDSIDLGTYVGSTTASFVASWSTFSPQGRQVATRCLDLLVVERGAQLGAHLAEIADLSSIPELVEMSQRLTHMRSEWTARYRLGTMLDRLQSESIPIAIQSAAELKAFLSEEGEAYVRSLTTGDFFDPLVGRLVFALYGAACRDGENTEILHDLAFDCIGIVGAIDPDRFELPVNENHLVVLGNFTNEEEAVTFALHLIQDVLVGMFRSTSDIKYQSHLAFALQELLQVCRFTSALVRPGGSNSSLPVKVRKRWEALPRIVVETSAPLLDKPLQLVYPPPLVVPHPIYPSHATYRQWVQAWASDLIHKVSGETARRIFQVFSPAVRNKDVGVAHHLLPHLVLNVIAYGDEEAAQVVRTELVTVLEDQVDLNSTSSPDKKLLSAQAVFMLLDHLTKWLRAVRQNIARQKADARRTARTAHEIVVEGQEQLVRVESILTSIDEGLMAKAAFQCKAYARTLMNMEQHIVLQRERKVPSTGLQDNYERLHEIYAYLDEPDGMEGVSTMILSPSLEHQIRQHESTGRWTSAQSCWEVRLQHEPDNLDYHLGLLRCLRNLGHYDSLRTHVKGVLTTHRNWGPQLVGYQVESEWMVGHWEEVQNLISQSDVRPPLVLMAQVLLAMRSGDEQAITTSLSEARRALGVSITASGASGYRRSYDAVLDLHIMHELEVINRIVKNLPSEPAAATQARDQSFTKLLHRLAARFDSTLPSFRIREPILNMRRTAFNLNGSHSLEAKDATGKLWLTSAKIARKAGHSQTAYSAILQAQRSEAPFSFIESARLVRARGEPLRALQELENSMRLSGYLASQQQENVIDLTGGQEDTRMKAKAHIIHARWMADSERYEDTKVHREFQTAAEMWPKWESGQFHLGQFQDECFKLLSPAEKKTRGMRMNLQTVRCFTRAIRYGSKYIYQTLPRVLTIWLDIAEYDEHSATDIFAKINVEVTRAVKQAPVYKWYTAFPQIVSRIGIKNDKAYETLSFLLSQVIQEYPKQALWPFTAVVKSTSSARAKRSKAILQKLKNSTRNDVAKRIQSMARLTEELLKFCRAEAREAKVMSMSRSYGSLYKLFKPEDTSHDILIPLQESLTANLPPQSSSENTHQPFPVDAPTFLSFFDEVEVMNSLAKPKKMSVRGSNGHTYTFLGKKEDLRKDGRLMDFDSILNKLLKSDSEARRRQLRIRTYSVVSLNEECGLIQWVPNTIPVRTILTSLYGRRGKSLWNAELRAAFDKIKAITNNREAGEAFVKEVLSVFPPVMHEWFVETFPEPSYWLASRMAYSRTAAVMSMVGYILGLGDRHCENILLDTNCGDVVHVDFDCLFEKGQALETPEIVPFRLTQNMVDALGVTGVEGVFRIACEVTLRLLRENKDCLMNVLDAFVHDPLVEWEEKRRRMERANHVQADMRAVSQDALGPIEEKLQGIFRPLKLSPGKQLSVSNHAQSLIHQASDNGNLARMYIGWAPHQ